MVEVDFNINILVVDDMPELRNSLISILNKEGFKRIDEAGDGIEAVEMLVNSLIKFDLIFSDINMPNCSGLEFLKKIKSHAKYRDIPVVMVSTENEKDVIMEAVILGASNYIIKPFDEETVKQKVFETLNKLKK